jgi:hypothetical protein
MACLLRDGFQGNLDAFGEETIMSSTDSHWARSRGSSAGSRRGWWPCEGEGLCRGASGKLGWYLVQHALDRGYEVGAVCREVSVDKLKEFSGHHDHPGNDGRSRGYTARGRGLRWRPHCLRPRGVHHYSSGTTQAVLGLARPGARLVFSCGSQITRDGQDVYSATDR